MARLPGHNDGVAGRTGRLIAFFTRAEPRGAPPTGWALAFDAAVAVGAAIGAVYEMAERGNVAAVRVSPAGYGPLSGPVPVPIRIVGGDLGGVVSVHPGFLLMAAAAMTALPLAARRFYPIGVWLAIGAAIVVVHSAYVPPVALGTAVYAAYSAITYSRYRNLSIAMVSVVTVAVAGTLGNELPRFPGRLTAIFAILPAGAAGLGIRVLRRRLALSTARLRRAADDAKAATERALTAERARIASELHDVVTHNVSVMIVQAGAARKIMASSPADAEDALLAVESTGREAMTELRIEKDPDAAWAIHPAGIMLLLSLAKKLGLARTALEPSINHFRTCSNMSSVSILHILKNIIGCAKSGQPIRWLSMGAGFHVACGGGIRV